MDKLKRAGFVVALCFINMLCFAQQQMDTSNEESTDIMRSNGKIYVVLVVVVTIVVGVFIYLINLDRKIKKLEKKDDNL